MRYLVIGAAGHAQEVAWSLREQIRSEGGRCELRFFDDRAPRGPLACGLGEVVGTIDAVPEHAGDGARLVLGVGLPHTKVALVERLAPLGLPSGQPSSIPEPTIGPNVVLGEGTYVAAGTIVTVNVWIGRFSEPGAAQTTTH